MKVICRCKNVSPPWFQTRLSWYLAGLESTIARDQLHLWATPCQPQSSIPSVASSSWCCFGGPGCCRNKNKQCRERSGKWQENLEPPCLFSASTTELFSIRSQTDCKWPQINLIMTKVEHCTCIQSIPCCFVTDTWRHSMSSIFAGSVGNNALTYVIWRLRDTMFLFDLV